MGPFFAILLLFSLACAAPCVLVPKLRRYTLRALLIPMAFGICAILGMGAVILVIAALVWLGLVVPERMGGTGAVVAGTALEVLFGLAGTWLAIRVARLFEIQLARLLDDLFSE